MDIHDILQNGIIFKGEKTPVENKDDKVKTKAKKTAYVRGQHNSGAAKMKAGIRKKRASRNKKK